MSRASVRFVFVVSVVIVVGLLLSAMVGPGSNPALMNTAPEALVPTATVAPALASSSPSGS
jgi:hypothetical protein